MKATWIIVADSTQARIFSIQSSASALEEVKDLAHPASRLQDREITTDLPGKIKSNNNIGHSYEQRTDPKQHEADSFAHEVAEHLESALNANKFDRLVIVAEPAFLGLLRNCLSGRVKKHVAHELDKHLTKHSPREIRACLPDYI